MKKKLCVCSFLSGKRAFLKMIFNFIILSLVTLPSFAQNTGDYRSVTTGLWTTLTTWQRYNGSAWSTPTSAQGYPGQFTGTGDVTVKSGHVVTIGTSGITTQAMGFLNIESTARLYLTGTNSTVTFTMGTPNLNIASGGDVFFYKKSKMVLVSDAVVKLSINLNGLVADVCNNNAELFIGAQKYAVCAGAPGDIFTFGQVITAGGTLDAVPSSNSPICHGSTINLTGNYGGAIGTTPTYSWAVTAPGGTVTNYSTQNVSIPNALTGTYTAKLTVTTTLSGTAYTNSETIYVTVNPLPTLTGASQVKTVCDGSPATINLTGLVPNTTFSLNYTINGVAQTAKTGLVADASGNSSFISSNLSVANNGQTLQVTGITITSSPTNCSQSFTQNATLSVWTYGAGTWTGTISTDWNTAGNWCGGVPTSSTDVYIPPTSVSVPRQPVIGTAGGLCRNITILSGASLTLSGSSSISVYGNWTNNGTFTANSGSASFISSAAAQTIGGTGSNTFYNLTINNTYSGGGVTAEGDITVNGVLNLAAANPSATNGTLEMVHNYGDYSNILTPTEDLTTTHTQAHDILDSYILYMGPNATTIGQGDVTGKVKRTTIAENIEYSFGNPYTSIIFNKNSTGVLPSEIMFVITKGADRGIHANKTNTVERLYQIIRTGGDLPTSFSIKLHYGADELNGNSESGLVLWDHHIPYSSTNTPHEHGKSAQNSTEKWLTLVGHGVNYLTSGEVIGGITKYWMISNTLLSGNSWLGAVYGHETEWDNASNWSGGNIPTCSDNVIIPSTTIVPHSPTLPSNASAKSVTIEEGGVLNGSAGSLTICGGIANNGGIGSWNNNGTFNPGTSTVIFNFQRTSNAETSTIAGTANFYNITLSSNTHLIIQSGAAVSIGGTFNKTGYLYAGEYENSFNYNGADQTIALPEENKYYNLILSGSGTKTLPSSAMTVSHDFTLSGTSSVTPSNALTIGEDLTLGSGTSFTAGALTHNIAGDFINNGATFTNTGSTINLNGSSLQTIGGSASTTFNNLILGNSSGFSLGKHVTVDGTLDMTSGLLTTGTYTVTVGCSGSITNAGTSSYVDGKLARIYCSAGSKDFPIGKGGNYRMLTLNYTALTGTSTVTAEQFESAISGTIPSNTTYQPERFWSIVQSGGSGFTYTLTLNGYPFDPGSGTPEILQGDGSSNTALTATYSSPDFSSSGITGFSNFAVASECDPATISVQPEATSACQDEGSPYFSVTASGSGISYQWQVNSGTGWSDIMSGSPYSGENSSHLVISSPPYSMNGFWYRAVVSRDCGVSVTSDSAMLTVNLKPAMALGSDPAVCYGVASADLEYSVVTGSPDNYRIDYDANAEAAGFTDVPYSTLPSSPITLNVPSTEGTYNGTMYVKNISTGCESEGYSFTVTVIPLPQGTVSGDTICLGADGQLTWVAEVGTGPFTVVYNDGIADRTANNVYSGSPFNVYINPFVTSEYNLVSVTGHYCQRSSSFTDDDATIVVQSGIWSGSISSDWNEAGNWCGGVPTSATNAIIPAGVTYMPHVNITDAETNDLTISSGSTLTIDAGKSLTVNGTLTNSAGIAGLVMKSDAAGTGSLMNKTQGVSATIERYIPDNNYYHYISSPVSWAMSSVFHYAWLYRWDEPVQQWTNINTLGVRIIPAKGYSLLLENVSGNPGIPPNNPVIFTGSVNVGQQGSDDNISNTDGADDLLEGFNLAGNPYTSAIDWDASSGWTRVNVDDAIYFWANSQYATYVDGVGTNGGTRYVPAMQGFFVRRTQSGYGTGTLKMNDDVRLINGTGFFKSNPGNVLSLKLEGNGYADETVIRFSDNATPAFDSRHDAYKLFGYNFVPQLYTGSNDGKLLSVNTLPDPVENTEVPAFVKVDTAVNLTVSASGINSFNPDILIYLEDHQDNTLTLLNQQASYSFHSESTDDPARFTVRFIKNTTGLSGNENNELITYMSGNDIVIHHAGEGIQNGEVELYTITGQLLMKRRLGSGTYHTIPVDFPAGYYLLKIQSSFFSASEKLFIH